MKSFSFELLQGVQTLQKGNTEAFPEHLRGEITAALDDPAGRDDMVLQLMTLLTVQPDHPDVRATRFVDGRLLYLCGRGTVVWGAETFRVQKNSSSRGTCVWRSS